MTIMNVGKSIPCLSNLRSTNGRSALRSRTTNAISLAAFVVLERRALLPFVDLRLLKHGILLPTFIIVIASGITMFLIYPTIVQLVRSPVPLGFGGNAVDAAHVQIPIMKMFLIIANITPFIINRIGSIKPTII